MSKYITAAFYLDNGNPALGLSPTLKIWDIESSSLIIDGAVMTELSSGIYKYEFIIYDSSKFYSILCDAGIVSGLTYRHSFGSTTDDYSVQLNEISASLANPWGGYGH